MPSQAAPGKIHNCMSCHVCKYVWCVCVCSFTTTSSHLQNPSKALRQAKGGVDKSASPGKNVRTLCVRVRRLYVCVCARECMSGARACLMDSDYMTGNISNSELSLELVPKRFPRATYLSGASGSAISHANAHALQLQSASAKVNVSQLFNLHTTASAPERTLARNGAKCSGAKVVRERLHRQQWCARVPKYPANVCAHIMYTSVCVCACVDIIV